MHRSRATDIGTPHIITPHGRSQLLTPDHTPHLGPSRPLTKVEIRNIISFGVIPPFIAGQHRTYRK